MPIVDCTVVAKNAREATKLELPAVDELFYWDDADWRRIGLVPSRFRMRGGPFVLTTFLHSGRTAVDYFHSHMDVFLSFCQDTISLFFEGVTDISQ